MNNFQEIANFIWSIADEVLRDDFKRGKYPDVILPFTVLRRLDCVLAPTKEKVLKRYEDLKAKGLENVEGQLRRAAGHSFYNISKFDFPKLLDDPKNIGKNLRAYINNFSENMRDVIDRFKLRGTIDTLDEKGLLFALVQKLSGADLHPDKVDNHTMGTIFEELIRRFNEQSNENPGEHFTPREVIRLMVRLLINGDRAVLKQESALRTVFDPACGSGGMLSIAKEHVLAEINPNAGIRLFGQEVNDETYAVCKSDLLIKGGDRDSDNIKPGSCLSADGHTRATFDYMLTNPPYGKDWKKESPEDPRMKVAYTFSVLRYVHDPVTQEFINIGVAVFSPDAQYLRAMCTSSYGRITHMFQRIDGQRFRQLSKHIQDQICAAEEDYKSALQFETAPTIERLLAKVLPPDDSAIQFSKAGVGLSADLDRTLHELFQRHVEQYAVSGESPRRTDEDVWRVFREPLDRVLVTPRLKPKRIVAPNFDYEFERAWKNQRWHVYEPLSFDLVEASSMLMKANRWLGQATSLMESSEPFKIHFMLGEPQDERLRGAFTKAENILNMIPAPKEFIRESEAEAFAEELAREVQGHPEEEPAE